MDTKKYLGQHWLYDQQSLDMVLAAAELHPEDTVLEVGPGTGSLTKLLAGKVQKIVAVEKDSDLISGLTKLKLPNVEVIEADILNFDFTKLPDSYKVVANIPYYLTSNLLRQLLESNNRPRLMSLLIQKEVAERITASPGQMSVLAFSVQYYANAQICGIVQKEKFLPPPKVDSAIIKITTRTHPYFIADSKKLFRIVKAGFGERRKQLRNSLAGGLHTDGRKISEILSEANVAQRVRAQELTLDQWSCIYSEIIKSDLLK